MEALAEMLADEIKSARVNRPTDLFILHSLAAILWLQEYVESLNDDAGAAEPDEYQSLTKEQIESRIGKRLIAIIQKQPEIAVVAAQTLGWTVIPTQTTSNPMHH